MTDNLTAWLGGVLDRIEQRAQAAANHGPTWRYSDGNIYPSDTSSHPGPIATGAYGDLDDAHGEHIAGNDPRQALAWVAGMRGILNLHTGEHECSVYTWSQGAPDVDRFHYVVEGEWCSTIRLLAASHAHKPGYRPEWGPQ